MQRRKDVATVEKTKQKKRRPSDVAKNCTPQWRGLSVVFLKIVLLTSVQSFLFYQNFEIGVY